MKTEEGIRSYVYECSNCNWSTNFLHNTGGFLPKECPACHLKKMNKSKKFVGWEITASTEQGGKGE